MGLVAVLLVCVGLRAWVAARSPVVPIDATLYLKAARQLQQEGASAIRRTPLHPGYPAAVAGVEAVLRAGGAPEGPRTWDAAGQIVAMLFAAGATAAAWWLASQVFDARVATLGIGLFTVTREWTTVGADALSDTMAIAFQMLCLALALKAEGLLRRRPRAACGLLAAAGLAAGAGYLARVEAILALATVLVLLAAAVLRKRAKWHTALLGGLASVAVAAAAVAPYIAQVGMVTPKHEISDYLRPLHAHAAGPALPLASIQQTTPYITADEFIGALHVSVAILVGLWVMTWAGVRVLRLRLPRAVRVFPSVSGGTLILTVLGLYLAAMMLRHLRWGTIGSRYFMLPSLLLASLAGAAVVILSRWWRLGAERLGRPGPRLRHACWLLYAALAIGLLLHASRPLHVQAVCYRRAGEYVRSISEPGDRIVVDRRRVVHYADREGVLNHLRRRLNRPQKQRQLIRWSRKKGFRYVVLVNRADRPARLSEPARERVGAVLLHRLACEDRGLVVEIYRIERPR